MTRRRTMLSLLTVPVLAGGSAAIAAQACTPSSSDCRDDHCVPTAGSTGSTASGAGGGATASSSSATGSGAGAGGSAASCPGEAPGCVNEWIGPNVLGEIGGIAGYKDALYVAANKAVYRIPFGTTTPTPIAGVPGQAGWADGNGDNARFRTIIAAKKKAEGKKAMEAKEYEKAYEAFAEAFQNQESPDLAGELGHAELETKRYRSAAEHLAWCLAHAPPDEVARFEATRRRLVEAKTHVATVRLNSSVPGAELRADGARVGAAPLPKDKEELYYEPGPHVFEGRHPDYEPSRKDYTLAAGSTTAVDLVLTPRQGAKPPPGDHVEPGDGARPSAAVMGVLFGFGGAAVVGGIAGMVVFAKAKSDASSLHDRTGDNGCKAPVDPSLTDTCASLSAAVARQDPAKIAGGVLIGGGAALVIAGAIYAALPRAPKKALVFPAVGPGQAGLSVYGSF